MFDNCLELLALSGRSLPHAVMMMIPEPWNNHESMDDEKRAFYEYHSSLMEPWDGPASIAFTDGIVVGAVLDRNGLRPSRYYVTKDDLVIMASEVGVCSTSRRNGCWKSAGCSRAACSWSTPRKGRIISDEEIKQRDGQRAALSRKWLQDNLVHFDDLPDAAEQAPAVESSSDAAAPAGLRLQLRRPAHQSSAPMAQDGIQPVGSMGTDTPLAVLSDKPQLLYNYFKQLFAQVTNPPIDPIREELITSTTLTIGLGGQPDRPAARELPAARAARPDSEQLRDWRSCGSIDLPGIKSVTLPILFNPSEGESRA